MVQGNVKTTEISLEVSSDYVYHGQVPVVPVLGVQKIYYYMELCGVFWFLNIGVGDGCEGLIFEGPSVGIADCILNSSKFFSVG